MIFEDSVTNVLLFIWHNSFFVGVLRACRRLWWAQILKKLKKVLKKFFKKFFKNEQFTAI